MAPGAQAAGTGQRPIDRAHRVRSLGRGLVRERRRAVSPHRAMARQRLQRRGNPPPLHRSTHGRWSSRSTGSQGLLTPSARLRCCPKIRQARREERSFVHQNERRATRHGGFWGATQRDGALLLRGRSLKTRARRACGNEAQHRIAATTPRPFGLRPKIRHAVLLVVHFYGQNFAPRALPGGFWGSNAVVTTA